MSNSVPIKPPESIGANRNLVRRPVFTIGIAGVLLIGVLILPLPMDGRGWSNVFDLAHAPSFLGMFLIVARILDPATLGLRSRSLSSRSALQLVALAVGLGLLGVAAELAQDLVGRNPSAIDVLANCAGLFAGLLLCLSRSIRFWGLRVALQAFSALTVLMPSISPLLELHECLLQQREFPLLASFERPRELNIWNPHAAVVSLSNDWSTHGRQSMKIEATAGSRYPGATLFEPIQDWSAFDSVELDLRNPGSRTLEVGISITDEQHPESGYAASDRFQDKFNVAPDSILTVQIDLSEVAAAPKDRQLLLHRIRAVNVFLLEKAPGEVLYVDHLRLTRRRLPEQAKTEHRP